MRGEVNKLKVLIALIIFFQGFSIALVSHPLIKTSPWLRIVGWLMMFLGVGYIYLLYYAKKVELPEEPGEPQESQELAKQMLTKRKIPQKKQIPSKVRDKSKPIKKVEEPSDQSILTRFMNWLVMKSEKFSQFTLPIIGAIIVDAVIIYNILINKSIDLKSWDLITILFGVSLILYNYFPDKFSFARDFFVFFIGLLFLILVFPPIFYQFILGPGGGAHITKVLLADPVAGLLNLFGIESYTEIIGENGGGVAYVNFKLLANGETASVGITDACSGVYTASIFLAAFITFVLIEYKRLDLKVGVIIGLGILTTYFANILRMTIIILVGHYYDTDPNELTNLSWWHINAGWMIFMAWIIPFWWLMYRFLMRKDFADNQNKDSDEK